MNKTLNINKLLNNINFIYYLGFLWGDGNINKKNNNISIELKYEDMLNIEHIFNNIFIFNKYERFRFDKRTNKTYHFKNLNISNKTLHNFLKENDYDKKTYISADKILNIISKENIKYFIRGYFDADGCIYIKNKITQISITSSIEQNWNFIENILNELNIFYTIKKTESIKSNYSQIRILNYIDIIKFLNYIYSENENICLTRKYQKYLDILKINKKFGKIYWTNEQLLYIKENYNTTKKVELSKKLNKTYWNIKYAYEHLI